MTTIQSLRLDGLLSFAPDSPAFGLGALNVLIGANGSASWHCLAGHAAVPVATVAIYTEGGDGKTARAVLRRPPTPRGLR